MKFLFFFMGIPLMIMSFFETAEVLPYANQLNLVVDGHEIQLTETERTDLQQQIYDLFEGSRTVPALGVVFEDMYQEDMQTGIHVVLKFDGVFEVNGLTFDELVFKVTPNAYGIGIIRGLEGEHNGRCLFVDLDGKTTQNFYDYVVSLDKVSVQTASDIEKEQIETDSHSASEEANGR